MRWVVSSEIWTSVSGTQREQKERVVAVAVAVAVLRRSRSLVWRGMDAADGCSGLGFPKVRSRDLHYLQVWRRQSLIAAAYIQYTVRACALRPVSQQAACRGLKGSAPEF